MKKTRVYELFILGNFLLTILFLIIHSPLGFITSGIIFICLSNTKSINNADSIIKNMKNRNKNFKIGKFNMKFIYRENKFTDFLFLITGISLVLCYIYCLLLQNGVISHKIIVGLLIPVNILVFPVVTGMHYVILGIKKKLILKKYDIKILAECIKCDESIHVTDNNGFNMRDVSYVVTYKYSYNKSDYVVSTMQPTHYKEAPVQGGSYYIYINSDDPTDFTDNLDDYKKYLIFGAIYLTISFIIITSILYVWMISK